MYPNYPNQGGYPPQPNQPFGGGPFGQNPGYPQPGQIGFGDPMGPPSYPNQPAYPSQPGYPQSQSGFPIAPSQPGYPSQPNYPPTQPGYPQGGYPQGGYPQGGYPQGGYPSNQPNFPPGPQPGGYPSSQPGYPGPGPTPNYPTQPGYNPPPPNNFGGPGNFPPNHGGPANFQPQPRIFAPTLRPYLNFNPKDDAAKLYKAMKGFGTDETTLIDILCRRTCQQRQEIAQQYKAGYGKDLLKNIKDETKGNFELVFKALLYLPSNLEAHDVKKSIDRMGTDEDSLIDILCTKTSAEMVGLKNAYRQMYGQNIESEVGGDASGYFKRFLVSLMAANRPEAPPDHHRAVQLAQALHKAGEKRLGTDEVEFNRIFATESFAQLRLVFEEYYKLTGHDIEKAIKTEMSGDVEKAFLAISKIARNPSGYYAERLYETMASSGTKDRALIRLIVLRSEIDLEEIKREFYKRYGKSLEQFIKSDCSGDYKRALLCLVGDPNWR